MELVFWLAAGLIAWTYLLFPAATLMRGAVAAAPEYPTLTPGREPRVSVVLTVRNEATAITGRIADLLSADYPGERLDVIVVCNACTDGSESVAHSVAERSARITVLVSPPDEGKAGALNAGVAAASGEIVVFADARQRFAPDAVRRLVETFSDPSVGAVSGRLVIGASADAAVRGVGLYWGFETRFRVAQSRSGSVMGVTGAIYAIRRQCFSPVPPNLILDDVYVPMQVVLRGSRVKLRPEAVAFDSASTRAGVEYRRKLRTMTGNIELLRVLPELLSPQRNPFFVRYLSHKVLRLASPLLLLAILLTGLALTPVPYGVAAVALLGLAAAGLLGLRFPHPALAIPAAFLVVQAAAAMAMLRPRRDARTLWAPAAASSGPAGRSA